MNAQTETVAAAPAAALPPGAFEIAGKLFMTDTKGRHVPLALVKPADLLIDETVRKMMAFAVDLNAQIARFRGHCFDDVGSLQALLDQEYGTGIGGAKGNISLTSFDGTLKVTVQVADQLMFGPELQAAKKLVDECLVEWGADTGDELRAVVNQTFDVDKEGQINRSALFSLMRLAIEDPRWVRAMEALRDSIRVIGSKTYIRFHRRDTPAGPWQAVTIDLASA
ncbi:DUF3164 family protein [Ancylobacter pratisalsi]|uniref:DUF3164 family protein n=1 Tax=Ancylobacter pratisalsi TaxID=1745854 RepID=A0A6P1YMW8_9HYPH|nr:DUF3164 family protein [Ancylobacter pratisalsi]QIB34777.1 DUF3164 family protein [Ancylobacter pratisalsi]